MDEIGIESCPVMALAVVLLNLQVLLPREFVTYKEITIMILKSVCVCARACERERGHCNVK